MSADADVVIVGAGAAGIGAVRRLAASSLSSIVLEATARVGGRAWTCDVAGMRLDLGCGWLHSADRNPWTRIAEAAGFAVDRRAPAWWQQYHDIGFSQTDRAAARRAYAAWEQRIVTAPPASDSAADALEPAGEWNAYLQAISGFMNGAGLEHVSVADYTAYDAAATRCNWRTPAGYGTLIAASLPHPIDLRLSTPVQSIELDGRGVELTTPVGAVRARAAILTVSTAVLAGSTIRLPPGLDAWRHYAADRAVRDVYIGGKPVVRDSEVLTIDFRAAVERLEQAQRRMLPLVPSFDYAKRTAEQIAPLSLRRFGDQ